MVKTMKFFHPADRVAVTVHRYGSKPAELYIHLSERDIKRLMNFGQSKQVRPARHGSAYLWTGPLRILSELPRPKRKAPTKPKPAPPIPRTVGRVARSIDRISGVKPKKKAKKPRKLSAYNLFVQKHRLAGKDMKEIGRLWRKRKK